MPRSATSPTFSNKIRRIAAHVKYRLQAAAAKANVVAQSSVTTYILHRRNMPLLWVVRDWAAVAAAACTAV